MDNLTHTLTGLMMSRAGLNRLTPHASLILMLAANAPDADAVGWFGGSTTHFCHHRGYTHAWAFLPLMALLPVLIGWFFRPKDTAFRWGGAYLISLIGVASHLLLDWTNTYAIRWSLPFSAEWHTGDLMFVVDPYVWLVFAFAVGAPWLSGLVSSEIGAKKTTGRGWSIFALLFLCAWIGLRWQMRDRAREALNSRLFDSRIPQRVIAVPDFKSPLHWTGVVELDNSFMVVPVNLLEEFDPTAGRQFFKPGPHPAITRARSAEAFRCLEDFSKAALWRVTPLAEPENAVRVELFDLRFGTPVEPGFFASAVVVNDRVENPSFAFGTPKFKR